MALMLCGSNMSQMQSTTAELDMFMTPFTSHGTLSTQVQGE